MSPKRLHTFFSAVLLFLFFSSSFCYQLHAEAPPTTTQSSRFRPGSLTPAQAREAFKPIRYAIVVGADQTDESSLPTLRYARRDARSMAKTLKDPNIGDFDEVIMLLNPSHVEVQEALRRASRLLTRDDLLLFYFSGHGSAHIDDDLQSSLFLLTRDSKLSTLKGSAINVRDIQATLAHMAPRRKVMIIDACYNGEGKSALSASTLAMRRRMKGIPSPRLNEPPRESEAHLFAAAVGQPALEDAGFASGVYTHFFIEALVGSEADTNRDGAVSVSEAHSFARDRTMRYTGYRQVPWANYRIVGREDVFLAGQARESVESAMLYSFNESLAGAGILIDGRPKGKLPGALSLSPGIHRLVLEAPDGSRIFDRRVQLHASNALAVDDLETLVRANERRARTLQWTAIGLSAGLASAAAVCGTQTISYHTYYQTTPFSTPEEAQAVAAKGARFKLVTNVFLSTSVLTGLFAGYVYIQSPQWVLRPGKESLHLRAAWSPSGAQALLALEF